MPFISCIFGYKVRGRALIRAEAEYGTCRIRYVQWTHIHSERLQTQSNTITDVTITTAVTSAMAAAKSNKEAERRFHFHGMEISIEFLLPASEGRKPFFPYFHFLNFDFYWLTISGSVFSLVEIFFCNVFSFFFLLFF